MFYLSHYQMIDVKWILLGMKLSYYWWDIFEKQNFALCSPPSQAEIPVSSLYSALNLEHWIFYPVELWEPWDFWAAVEDFGFIHDLYTYITGICCMCQVEACPWTCVISWLSCPSQFTGEKGLIAAIIFCLESLVWWSEKEQSCPERRGFSVVPAGQFVIVWQLLN